MWRFGVSILRVSNISFGFWDAILRTIVFSVLDWFRMIRALAVHVPMREGQD